MPAPQYHPAVPAAVDELCDRFEDALRRGERPRIEDRLAEVGPAADSALPELVAVELDYRVRAGEPATAADYFVRFPRLLADPAAALRLVAVEFRAAKTHTPLLSEGDFRCRYPDLANL